MSRGTYTGYRQFDIDEFGGEEIVGSLEYIHKHVSMYGFIALVS
jgi:hypothetical protein